MVGFSGTTAPPRAAGAVRAGDVGSVILFARQHRLALADARADRRAAAGRPRRRQPQAADRHRPGGRRGQAHARAWRRRCRRPQMAATGSVGHRHRPGPGDRRRRCAAGGSTWTWRRSSTCPPPATPSSGARGGRSRSTPCTVARYASAFALRPAVARRGGHRQALPGPRARRPPTPTSPTWSCTPRAAQRAAALTPYETMIPDGVDAVMASVAGFPAYDHSGTVAALSRPIVTGLLRGTAAASRGVVDHRRARHLHRPRRAHRRRAGGRRRLGHPAVHRLGARRAARAAGGATRGPDHAAQTPTPPIGASSR